MIIVGECMNIIPTVLEKSSNHEYAYDLYSRMLKDRIVFLTGEITDELANLIVCELLYLDSLSHEEISLYINSPGGSVTAGFAIFDTMNYIQSEVRTIVVGMAASMAAFLLACGSTGKRCALSNAEVMIHQPLGGVNGQATEMKIACDRILRMRKKLNQILAHQTKKTMKTIEKDTERDYFMDALEVKKYGLLDVIL